MDEQKIITNTITSKNNKQESNSTINKKTHWKTGIQAVQNLRLVWLDSTIGEASNDTPINIIANSRQIIDAATKFTDIDECIDFVTGIEDETIFMILSGELSPTIIPVIHDIAQINDIYMFGELQTQKEQFKIDWPKVKGVFTNMTSMYEVLNQSVKKHHHNSVSMNFVKSSDVTQNSDLDQLDKSFMYTEILKEILLTIDFQLEHFNEFLVYCREQFAGNTIELKNVDKVENEYYHYQSIWWYTSESFLYTMLNRALRLMEIDLIIKMGFFVRDLHNHIVALHTEQYGNTYRSNSLTVYRGQGLSQADFDQLRETKGGLISFNHFLSTSLDRAVSVAYAESSQDNVGLVSVLFQITIDPSISSTPFANIRNVSAYQTEQEILFSMHSIFRIGQIKRIDDNSHLWQIDLTLTGDNDPQLSAITDSMREETNGPNGWHRLGKLLLRLGHLNKAEELYKILLEKTTNKNEEALLYYQFGMVKHTQGEYKEAIEFYEKTLAIQQNILPINSIELATIYINFGVSHHAMAEHSKALSYYQKSLEIFETALPVDHPSLASFYGNIGGVYDGMGEYSIALSYHEKALKISQKFLPQYHLNLAISYNNIAVQYLKMSNYSQALSHCRSALEIFEKILPTGHPTLAQCYNNIGSVYDILSDYSTALSYFEKALALRKDTISPNHPNFAQTYTNIGLLDGHNGEYSKAISSFKKAIEILRKNLPEHHPHLICSYNNIGSMYMNAGDYQKALSFHEKTLQICEKTFPVNHPDWATCFDNIGKVYHHMNDYSKALSFYVKALEIYQKVFSPNHPDLAISYNNIGTTYHKLGDCSKALSYYKMAVEIHEKTLPPNHPEMSNFYHNIGGIYYYMSKYSDALSYYIKALKICRETLVENHPYSAETYQHIGMVFFKMRMPSKAVYYCEQALKMIKHSLPDNQSLIQSYEDYLQFMKNS